MNVEWAKVKQSVKGPSLWQRTDTRNRYLPMDTDRKPGTDCYGVSRKHAFMIYALKCERAAQTNTMEVQR